MQYNGLILNLDHFDGDVYVKDSDFRENLFRYSGCEFFEEELETGFVSNDGEDYTNKISRINRLNAEVWPVTLAHSSGADEAR